YVYKTLFSKEQVTFDDLTETKSVTSALYIDFGQGDGGEVDDTPMAFDDIALQQLEEPVQLPDENPEAFAVRYDKGLRGHRLLTVGPRTVSEKSGPTSVGKLGSFSPITRGGGGGIVRRE